MVKLAVDVMGFENDISQAIIGCEKFLSNHTDVEVHLVGPSDSLTQLINQSQYKQSFQIVHADQFIDQNDEILAIRHKPNSSMQVTANLLKDGKVDGLLSAGNTGVFVYIMYSTIGMLDGVNKIGLMPTIPTVNNQPVNLVDVGANVNIDPTDLVKFAIMANVYAKQRIQSPRIGVLNIGTEKHKGLELQRITSELIQKTSLNYIGFIESNKILSGLVDVIVTDGFTGNIALKACEGSVKTLASQIKKEFKKPFNFLAALLAYPILKKIVKRFDYKNHAGALVLGLKQICVKTHGSADFKQFHSSLEMLYACVKNNLIQKMTHEIKKYDEQ